MVSKKWLSVNAERRCPICDEIKGCRIADDGREAACCRFSHGATRSISAKDGTLYYIHPITPEPQADPAPPGNAVLEMARRYVAAGISIVPVLADGSKRAALDTWKELQERLPSDDELREWYGCGEILGIATIGGAVSGNMEQIDFDLNAESIYPRWVELVEAELAGLIARLTTIRTPKDGYHSKYRVADFAVPGNIKLAMSADKKVIIETRGEGGYCVAPGSPAECHETGRLYENIGGPFIPPTISIAERNCLIRCARAFDEAPPKASATATASNGDLRPGDDFDLRGWSWGEILKPHGWTLAHLGKDSVFYWRRPGKTEPGWSATTGKCKGLNGEELFRVFSSNAHPFEDGHAYGKFRTFALLNYGGNLSEAARALSRQGFGTNGSGPKVRIGGSSANGENAPPEPEQWGKPIPLNEMPQAPPFPLDVLPPALRRFAEEAARSIPCPPDYVAVPMLMMAGAAIGASRALEIKRGRLERPCLYAAVVGSPSCGKTPALTFAARPLYAEQSRLYEVYRRERMAREQGVDEAPKPIERTLYVADVTVEKLASILQENPRGVAVVRDELTGWVRSMDQYRSGKGADRQFWLSAWSGDPISVHRKNQESGPVRVAHPFISVVGGLPPDLLTTMRGEHVAADGFLERLLFAFPDPFPASGETWGSISTECEEAWSNCLARLRGFEMMEDHERGARPCFVRLTSCGRTAWQRFTDALAADRNDDATPDGIKSALGKLNSYGARLALIVHCLRLATGEAEDENVDGESVDRAASLVRYFRGHLLRVYSAMDAAPRVADARKLLRWIVSNRLQRFVKRDAYQAAKGTFKTVEEMAPALALLEKHGFIRTELSTARPGPGRKPSPGYEVNPAAFQTDPHNSHNSHNCERS